MKKIFLIIIIQTFSIYTFSQKTYKKVDKYFNENSFNKCIEIAKKYRQTDGTNYILPLFISKSYFELFKTEKPEIKKKNLRFSLKFASKIKNVDKKSLYIKEYDNFLKQLHKTTVSYADSLFNTKNKEKSKIYYKYIAEVYKDTIYGYLHFYPPIKKEKTVGLNSTTEKINQTDASGRKQGLWTKKFKNGVIAYKVYFKNNKPIGEYKRYHTNGMLYAFLNYSETSDTADAKLFNEKGVLIAKGTYFGKIKINKWSYYIKKQLVKTEIYKNGKLNGKSKVFFRNGNIAEERNWENGIENGVWRQYHENNKVKIEMRIENGKRNSVYYKYYQSGRFEIKGKYKDDSMHGTWEYYNKSGKLLKKIEYIDGVAENQKELDAEQDEYLRKLEENGKRLVDPANFINNPEEYMRRSGM